MSGYQYYELTAVDRPLRSRELDALRGLSTRAHITPTSFVNTHQWGNCDAVSAWCKGDYVIVTAVSEDEEGDDFDKPTLIERLTHAGL